MAHSDSNIWGSFTRREKRVLHQLHLQQQQQQQSPSSVAARASPSAPLQDKDDLEVIVNPSAFSTPKASTKLSNLEEDTTAQSEDINSGTSTVTHQEKTQEGNTRKTQQTKITPKMAASFVFLPPNLPKFGCQPGEDFAQFSRTFGRLCKGFGLDDERIVALLPIHLTDKALADYNELEQKGKLNDKTYDEVCKELKQKFKGAKEWGRMTEATFNEKMKPGESVATFYGRIRSCAEKAGLLDSETDEMKAEQWMLIKFRDGITNISLRRHLLQNQPTTLAETIAHATDWENLEVALKQQAPVQEERVHHVEQDHSELTRALNALAKLNLEQVKSAERGHHITCYTCGGVGHISRVCPSKGIS